MKKPNFGTIVFLLAGAVLVALGSATSGLVCVGIGILFYGTS